MSVQPRFAGKAAGGGGGCGKQTRNHSVKKLYGQEVRCTDRGRFVDGKAEMQRHYIYAAAL